MNTKTFKGPFHFSHMDKLEDINSYGIYIWGFMFNYDKKVIQEPICFNKATINSCPESDVNTGRIFIPYYVGRAIGVKIKTRLEKHHNVKKGDASKFVRMKEHYYSKFFNDCCFPLPTKRGNWIENDIYTLDNIRANIKYFNNLTLLNELYDDSVEPKTLGESKCSITKISIIENNKRGNIPDTLDNIVNKDKKNNFWFCYLPFKKEESIEELEPFTFYALKGKTISKTDHFKNVKKQHPIKSEPSCSYLFHLNEEGFLTPKTGCQDGWPGYTK